MEKKLYYMCESFALSHNVSQEAIAEIQVPLYEDITLYDDKGSYRVANFVEQFWRYAERCYYTLDAESVNAHLVKVKKVEAYITKGNDVKRELIIRFVFENGAIFEADSLCHFYLNDENFTRSDARRLISRCQSIAPHLFFPDCEIRSTMLTFEDEIWDLEDIDILWK